MKNIRASIFAVTASLTLTQSALSQDVISDVKTAVVAEKADIAAVVKAAAAANPAQAAEIAQAAVKALYLRSNDSDDEATIESIIQAAIEGSKANVEYANSIRAVAESALLKPDANSKPIQGGETEDDAEDSDTIISETPGDTGGLAPLDAPGIDPLGNPLAPFTDGGTGSVGGVGAAGLLTSDSAPPAGALTGVFFGGGGGSSAGGGTPSDTADLGTAGGGGTTSPPVNPPVVTQP